MAFVCVTYRPYSGSEKETTAFSLQCEKCEANFTVHDPVMDADGIGGFTMTAADGTVTELPA